MKTKTVYLAGPVDGRGRLQENWRAANSWRKRLIKNYPQIDFLNPLRRETENHDLDCKTMVEMDFKDVEESDFVLVGYRPEWPSVGTYMEIKHAFDRGIPVILVNPTNHLLGSFLKYHVSYEVRTYVEAMKIIDAAH